MTRRRAVPTRRRCGVLMLCVLAVACGRSSSPEPAPSEGPPSAEPTPAAAPVTLDVYLREALIAAGHDRAGTRALFGTPDSVFRAPVTNRHDPTITDSVVALHYPDARYVFYVVTSARSDLLDHAIITGNRHLRHTPGVGTPADSLHAWFGEPLVTRAGEVEYDCRDCEVPLPVTFVLADGRVRAVRFDLYVD